MALAIALLMASATVPAADEPTSSSSAEALYLDDVPLVLAGTRLAQPLHESPVAITVIDREMIDASGAREVPDLFRLVPGMLVGSRSGHDRDVGYLGLLDAFSRRMQVLIDGRSAYDPLVGGVNWSAIPLDVEDIERIEVVRGPNAASFGTNAFLGTIIITTRQPFDMARTHAVARTGSDGVLDAHAGFGDIRADWSYHVTFSHREDDGFDNRHDSKKTNYVRGDLGYWLDAGSRLEFQGGYSEGDLGAEDSLGERTVDTEDGHLLGRWVREWSADDQLRITAYHHWTNWEESDTASEFFGPFLLTADVERNIETERSSVEIEHRLRIAEAWRGVWGGEARFDSAEDEFDLGTSSTIDNDIYRVFGHVEWQIDDRTQASLGVMWEDSDLVDSELSPRAGLVWQPAGGHTLRASVSQATRSPVLFEAYSNQGITLDIAAPPPQFGCDAFYAAGYAAFGLGAPPIPAPCQARALLNWTRTELEPEEITSYELGYRYGAGLGGLPGEVDIDLKLFRKELDDMIVSEFIPTPLASGGLINVNGVAIDYDNAGEVTLDGIEGSVEWRLPPATRLIGGFSVVDADAENAASDELAESVPDYTLMAMLIHRFDGGLTASMTVNHVDELRYVGDGGRVDAVTRIDARVAYPIRIGGTRGEVAATLQNLGEEYEDFDPDNRVGTRVLVTLKLESP